MTYKGNPFIVALYLNGERIEHVYGNQFDKEALHYAFQSGMLRQAVISCSSFKRFYEGKESPIEWREVRFTFTQEIVEDKLNVTILKFELNDPAIELQEGKLVYDPRTWEIVHGNSVEKNN